MHIEPLRKSKRETKKAKGEKPMSIVQGGDGKCIGTHPMLLKFGLQTRGFDRCRLRGRQSCQRMRRSFVFQMMPFFFLI